MAHQGHMVSETISTLTRRRTGVAMAGCVAGGTEGRRHEQRCGEWYVVYALRIRLFLELHRPRLSSQGVAAAVLTCLN